MTELTQSLTVQLTDEWAKQHMARAVPGAYWSDVHKHWCVEDPTPRASAVILRLFPELVRDYPELEALRDQLAQDVRPFDNATPLGLRISAERVRARLQEDGHDFYDFQELDLGYICAVLEEHGGAYIGWARGMGKTLGTAAIIDELHLNQVLVVAPNTAKQTVWGQELHRFCDWLDIIILPNEKHKREYAMECVKRFIKEGRAFVLVVHYEALAIIGGKDGRGWNKYGEWELVVADEAHRLKNPKAKMVRAIKKIPSRRRLCLSGSIIENHAEELFSPLQWLYPDRYRSKWRDWNDRFLDYIEGGYGKICIGIKEDRLPDMRDELGVIMVYRRKEDELDMPERTDQTLYIELTKSQRKVYDDLINECVGKLDDDKFVYAIDGLTLLIKLRQVATGLDLLGDVSDSSKLDVAVEMIEDAEDEAFVVFSWYKAAAYALAERLEKRGIQSFVVTGDVSHQDRAAYIDRFQAGEGRVFIGTLSTLGESVNLQRASNAIFLDRSWNPATNIQAADRIYRIGQDKPVTITHLIARNTVDELRVLPTIANKEALRRLILGGL